MPNPYRELFVVPGARGFVVAAFVGRMSMSMIGLGIVLLVSAVTGSYGLAGAVAATEAAAMALAAPQIGRLTDRHGQGRVLVPAAAVHGTALASLMACAQLAAPYWTPFVSAAAAGAAYPRGFPFVVLVFLALGAVFGSLEVFVPAHARNEGFAWVTTAIGVGLAIGSPLAGRVVDVAGGRVALLVPLAAGSLAALIEVAATGRLRVR